VGRSKNEALDAAEQHGYVRGVAELRARLVPFAGVDAPEEPANDLQSVRLELLAPMHEAVRRYEGQLVEQLLEAPREVQRAEVELAEARARAEDVDAECRDELERRRRARAERAVVVRDVARVLGRRPDRQLPDQLGVAEAAAAVAEAERVLAMFTAHARALRTELTAVREWLDGWLADAEHYRAQREELRRDTGPLPDWVRRYDSLAAFFAEDPRRAGVGNGDGGTDYGDAWQWEDPDSPWSPHAWRVSWLAATCELYAAHALPARDAVLPGPAVLLLATVPAARLDEVHRVLVAAQQRQRERNSLLALAGQLAPWVAGGDATLSYRVAG